jgi:hypothetical protein
MDPQSIATQAELPDVTTGQSTWLETVQGLAPETHNRFATSFMGELSFAIAIRTPMHVRASPLPALPCSPGVSLYP